MNQPLKTYVVLIRDHTYSMTNSGLTEIAMKNFNSEIANIECQVAENFDIVVSTICCGDPRNISRGTQPTVVVQHQNSSATVLKPLTSYFAYATGTPLIDSVGKAIEILKAVPDYDDPNVSFLVTTMTDGGENASRIWNAKIKNEIINLQKTDRWTFVFRVPTYYCDQVINMFGVYSDNVRGWDTTVSGAKQDSVATVAATTTYFNVRRNGVRASNNFYVDTSRLQESEVKNLKNIKNDVVAWSVDEDGIQVRDFVERMMCGKHMMKGGAFYQLVKYEKKVQPYKMILVRDKTTGNVYFGAQARHLLGLPCSTDISLSPGNLSNKYDVFIQSTSVNRKLPIGTTLIYWENVGVAFKEGKSSEAA